MTFDEFIASFQKELSGPLPGRDFQLAMSSMRRIRELMKSGTQPDAQKSSVLILLFPDSATGIPKTVLIRRPAYGGVHSGQISLPGGRHEVHDNDLAGTALRETREEIGLDTGKVSLIGELTELYIPPSNYLVQPFVGYMKEVPVFRRDPREVEQIIEIRIRDLLDEKNRTHRQIRIRSGIRIRVPSFVIDGNIIWGATAMILNEFKAIAGRIPLRNSSG